MKPSLTDTLCTRCGLCCDGSLFADVELSGRAEATGLEILGLETDDDDADGGLLLLPCGALQGRRCSIYAHRPQCCRTFECRLLQDVRRGTVSVERAREHITEALSRIGRVRALMAQLGRRGRRLPLAESCAETLAREAGADRRLNRKRAALETAMSSVEALIRKVFLGSGEASPSRRSPLVTDADHPAAEVASKIRLQHVTAPSALASSLQSVTATRRPRSIRRSRVRGY